MHGEVKVTKPCSAKPAADASLSGRREKVVNRDMLPQAFKTWRQSRVRVGVSEVQVKILSHLDSRTSRTYPRRTSKMM
jgi:hypothetical protein